MIHFFSLWILNFLLCKQDCSIPQSPYPFWTCCEIKYGPCAHKSSRLRSVPWELLFFEAKYEGPSWEFCTLEGQVQLSCKLTGRYITSFTVTVKQPMKTEQKTNSLAKKSSAGGSILFKHFHKMLSAVFRSLKASHSHCQFMAGTHKMNKCN